MKKIAPLSIDFFFFKKVTDAVPAIITVYSLKTGQYLYVNQSIKQLLGYDPISFMEGGHVFATSLVHPDDLAHITTKNAEALKKSNDPKSAKKMDQTIVQFEYRMKHKNGHYIWLETDGSVFQRDKNNKVELVLNVSVDITSRKYSEERLDIVRRELEQTVLKRSSELEETVQDLKNIKYALDQSSIVAITDKSGMIQYVNDKFVEISKYSRVELIGKTHRLINSKYHPKEFMKNLWNTILAGKIWHGEIRNRGKNGRLYWVDTTITPLLDKKGQPKQFIAIHNDITVRKELEEKKDEFISVASHELKTPLTTAKAYAQILERLTKEQKDDKFADYVVRMNTQMQKLTRLVYELLDTTKIQSGRLELSKEEFKLLRLVKEVVSDIRATNKVYKITIKNQENYTISADRDRIGQVIQNFITNAIKYSPDKKEIEIGYKKETDIMTLYVKDYGIGIAEDQRDKIFDRFYQIDENMSKHDPSLALGLYICREIILRHNGKIWVESTEGVGSTFSFTIPIE